MNHTPPYLFRSQEDHHDVIDIGKHDFLFGFYFTLCTEVSQQSGLTKMAAVNSLASKETIKARSSLFFGSVTLCYLMITGRVMLRNLPRSSIGSLRNYDGNCNENVTLKLNFAVSVLRLFHVGALSLAWHERLSCKDKE